MPDVVRDGLGNPLLKGEPVNRVPNQGQIAFRSGFSDVIASGWQANDWFSPAGDPTVITTGAGQAVSQSAGNGVMTSGTTANAETIMRSKRAFTAPFTLRYSSVLSQRIINNNFFVEMVDVVGDNLAFNIVSTTLVDITFPVKHPFSAANVGQSMYLGGMVTAAAVIPGRYAIQSIIDQYTVRFTVAAWPATGTGTVCLFGWNYYRVLYDSTVATNAKFDTQRNGWNSGDTTITTNTSASPGHVALMNAEDGNVGVGDQLSASSTAVQTTLRGSRSVNIPDNNVQLVLQFRMMNGTTNPASTTTWTVGFVQVEDYIPQQVSLNGARFGALNAAMPVAVQGTPSVNSTAVAAPTIVQGQSIPTVSATATQGPTILPHKAIAAATTNSTLVLTGARRLVGGAVHNVSAAVKYFKLYNKATAPTVGTDTPILTIAIPAGQTIYIGDCIGIYALPFSLGLGYGITGAAADADTTALTAGDVIVNLTYI